MILLTNKDAGYAPSSMFPSLQAWLDSGETMLYLVPGRHNVGSGLVLNTPGATIYGPGTLAAPTSGQTVLAMAGSDQTASVKIDGNRLALYGIHATGDNPTITGCSIRSIVNTNGSPRGIFTSTKTGVTITNNRIRDVHGPGDTERGNANGMTRGIVAHSLTVPTTPTLISGNLVDNVTGEETDGIALLHSDASGSTYLSSHTTVANNRVRNCGRRFYKVQSSNVVVTGNWGWNDADHAVVNPSAGIGIVGSHGVEVTNNRIDGSNGHAALAIEGMENDVSREIVIRGNSLRESTNTSHAIYGVHASDVTIEGNTITGGSHYIGGGNISGLSVHGNTLRGGVMSNPAFNFSSSVTGQVWANNVPDSRRTVTGTNVVFDSNF